MTDFHLNHNVVEILGVPNLHFYQALKFVTKRNKVLGVDKFVPRTQPCLSYLYIINRNTDVFFFILLGNLTVL